MRVLHLPVAYLPWTTGGREVYCASLCRALAKLDGESIVAIHQDCSGREPLGQHVHEGIPVHVLPPLPEFLSRQSSYTKAYTAIPGFVTLLSELKPDLVHFHDQGGGASLSHLRAVKEAKLPAVLTYHSPGQTCPQRELLRFGKLPCDGEVRLQRCTACRLKVSGVPVPLNELMSLMEWPGFDPWAESPISRAMTARMMTRLFRDALQEFIREADAIIVYAHWAREVWRRNRCDDSKLYFVDTGGPETIRRGHRRYSPGSGPLRIACSGRCTSIKGQHVLIDAIKRLPESARVEVHFLGPYWADEFGTRLKVRIAGDRRFREPRMVPNQDLLPVLADMDLVVVPSLWLETGPLAVLDAFSAGVPVIGSRLGGIAERVRDGIDGLLFQPGNAHELAAHIRVILERPEKLALMRDRVRSSRTFDDVAREHLLIYTRVLGG